MGFLCVDHKINPISIYLVLISTSLIPLPWQYPMSGFVLTFQLLSRYFLGQAFRQLGLEDLLDNVQVPGQRLRYYKILGHQNFPLVDVSNKKFWWDINIHKPTNKHHDEGPFFIVSLKCGVLTHQELEFGNLPRPPSRPWSTSWRITQRRRWPFSPAP